MLAGKCIIIIIIIIIIITIIIITSKLKLKLTVEKYCIHNLGKDQWKVNNFTSEIIASCS